MDAEGIFKKYCQRNTVALFKGFLMMLEDLQKEHQINFDKLRDSLPEDYDCLIEQADYFCDEKLQHLRKRTLDIGNEAIRNMEGEIENFTINFTFNN
ncbi:MAG: hypothetical protein CL512_03990 [Actinobacteria bacterium]|nr:hypothetical protein [Actinomycetota bacterium]|tara:strand:+ start:1311 stop:1601 length:291 start_codon:yes stop_codon:yes gene_type:complete